MTFRKTILGIVFCLLSAVAVADNVYDIRPVPQQQERLQGVAALAGQVNVVAGAGIDGYTIDRAKEVLTEHGLTPVVARKAKKGANVLYLGVNGSKDLADREAKRLGLKRDVFKQPKYDRHALTVRQEGNAAEVLILGESTDAVFCGLASLEQMLDQAQGGQLSCVDIYDFADTQYRGVIEGYYGVPYSKEVTADLFRFMARYKMNTYMYGAKSDPYHSQYWDKPYPETITPEQQEVGMLTEGMMRQLTDVAHRTKVNFIWAIHPGQAFTDKNQEDVLDRIMGKLRLMHKLGVRQFGVFVDDVGVPSDSAVLALNANRLTQLQQMIDKEWNGRKALAADTVKPLHFVPQLYAFSWVNRQQGERFFNSLSSTPKKVCIYITGRAVWTVPNSEDPELVSSWLGRDVAWWWNYPCNDNDMNKIFPLDTYRNFDDEAHIDRHATLVPDLKGVNTLISNPMQQGEISKIALYSIADYAWHRAAFDNDASWMASLKAIFGERAKAAFRLLPLTRHYDTNTRLADCIRQWKGKPHCRKGVKALIDELESLQADAKTLAEMGQSESESDRLLWHELQPYVEKVGDMCAIVKTLVSPDATDAQRQQARQQAAQLDKSPKYQFSVLNGMGNDIKLSKRVAEPAAKLLRPFVDQLVAAERVGVCEHNHEQAEK